MALKAFFDKLKGTFETFFQIGGKNAPGIGKVDASRLGVFEDDGTTLANMRGKDPATAQDFLTLAYFDANNAAANGLTISKFPLGFAAIQTSTAGNIPNSAIIHDTRLDVTTVYDNAATIKAERDGDVTIVLMPTDANDPELVGIYTQRQTQDYGVTGSAEVKVTIANAPTVGASVLYVAFSVPTDIT